MPLPIRVTGGGLPAPPLIFCKALSAAVVEGVKVALQSLSGAAEKDIAGEAKHRGFAR